MDTFDFENMDDDAEQTGSRKENFEEEIKKFKERLKNGGGSTNIEALEEITSFYFENEKYEEALHFINLLLEYLPFSADTWQRKGIILNNLQRYNEALECFEYVKVEGKNCDWVPATQLSELKWPGEMHSFLA